MVVGGKKRCAIVCPHALCNKLVIQKKEKKFKNGKKIKFSNKTYKY